MTLKTAPVPSLDTFACETSWIPFAFEICFSRLTRRGSEAVDFRYFFCCWVCSCCDWLCCGGLRLGLLLGLLLGLVRRDALRDQLVGDLGRLRVDLLLGLLLLLRRSGR